MHGHSTDHLVTIHLASNRICDEPNPFQNIRIDSATFVYTSHHHHHRSTVLSDHSLLCIPRQIFAVACNFEARCLSVILHVIVIISFLLLLDYILLRSDRILGNWHWWCGRLGTRKSSLCIVKQMIKQESAQHIRSVLTFQRLFSLKTFVRHTTIFSIFGNSCC